MEAFSPDAIRHLALFAPPFIISLTFHEFSHAWVADKLGDSTARYLGRLTMDPMAHISWMGTVIFPAMAVLTGAPLFGWANPVPVDMRNFKKPRLGMAYVAAAGPISNIFLGTICTAILAFVIKHAELGGMSAGGPTQSGGVAAASIEMLLMAVQLNLFLAFFNLIPIPPLDGSRILQGFISHKSADKMDEYSNYGQMILLLLFFAGALRVMAIPVYIFMNFLFSIFNIPI